MAVDVDRVKLLLMTFVKRIVKGNFQEERALPEEREALGAAKLPVRDRLAQDYLAWRRAVLWAAAVLLGINVIVGLYDWITLLSDDQFAGAGSGTLKFLATLLFLTIPAGATLTVLAALDWTDVRRSRRRVRWGWAVMGLTPVVLALLPWRELVTEDRARGIVGSTLEQARMGVGAAAAILLLAKIGPLILGLSSGLVRASLVLKTLLPESVAPGWAAVVFAPLYALFFVSVLVGIIQIGGGLLATCGVGALIAAQALYVLAAKDLTRSIGDGDVAGTVQPVRNRAATVSVAGGVFLVAALLDLEQVGGEDVLLMLVQFGGGLLAFMVVAADLMLAVLQRVHRQAESFHASEFAASLGAKVASLEQVGLDRMATGYATEEVRMTRPTEDDQP